MATPRRSRLLQGVSFQHHDHTAALIRERLGAKGSSARCPAHEDKQASLSIGEKDGKVLLKCHAGCSQAAVIEALQALEIWPKSDAGGLTVAALAQAKRLPEQLLRDSGFADDKTKGGRPVVRMDYRDAGGDITCVRYRGAVDTNGSGLKFWFRKGDKQQLFGLWRLKTTKPVTVVEGETDSIALWAAGLNAVGVPGADAWSDRRFAAHLAQCPVIYVHVEPDAGGEKFRAKFEASKLRDRVKFFTVAPAAKDPCALRALNIEGFFAAIEAAQARELPKAPKVQSNPDAAPFEIHDSDIANGKRLAARHGRDMKYTPERGWFVWDGRRWAADEKGILVQARAKETAIAIFDEIRDAPDRKARMQHAQRSQSKAAAEAMIWMARSEPGIPTRLTELDRDGWLFNVANGTLELRTGELRPHAREDLISNIADIRFDRDAECELWDAFLWRILDRDEELYTYLRRFVGYLLVGDTSEQSLHFLYGLGANGKTVFCEVIMRLLGDYALAASPEMIMIRRHGGIPNDVARLRGIRAALMNETSQGSRFDESKLKDLTGGDTLNARFLHQEFFDFRPTHRIVIRGNHKPSINGTDDGIWRRLRLVPFSVQIPIEDQDHDLLRKLEGELPGILNWALQGCREWQDIGLKPPPIVSAAIAEYRAESDTLGRFITECCETRNLAQVKSSALFKRYQEYCEQAGERWMASKDFPHEMQRRGFEHKRSKAASVFLGIELAEATEAANWGAE
jgi:putative DNA primase/helicase